MADITSKITETPEYQAYANKKYNLGKDEYPTFENFLASMTPQERAEYEKKYAEPVAEAQKAGKDQEAKDIYTYSEEYLNYIERTTGASVIRVDNPNDKVALRVKLSDKQKPNTMPTPEEFLASMTPEERAEFDKKYGENVLEDNVGDENNTELKTEEDEKTQTKTEDEVEKDDNILENVNDFERVRSQYSDQNEIWLDRIRVKVLQGMNKVESSIDVDNLEIENLIDEVKKADELNDEEKLQYNQNVEQNLRNELNFGIVPPKALVDWDERLSDQIAETKKKDSSADTTADEAVLNAVRNRMDNLIKDVAEKTGLYYVDKSNIADVYDGYVEMIQRRQPDQSLADAALKNLDDMAAVYDNDFGLAGKTENDAKDMEKVAKDTSEKLADFELSPESLKIAQSLRFKDESGNDVPQFLDDKGQPALNGTKVRPGTQLEALINAAKSDALDDQVLIENKIADKKVIYAAANDSFVLNTAMMVNADRIGNKEKPVPFGTLRNNLLNGTTYDVTPNGFEGALDAYANKKTSKLARLGKKIGKEAPVIGTLYEPVRKIDKLEKLRFDEKADTKKYRRQFWTGLACNAALVGGISASFAVASKIPGAQPYCVAASAGLAVVGMTVAYQQRRKAAHAQGKKYNFFKDPEGMTNVLLSGAALAAVAWGRPEGLYAVMGGNMIRNGYFSLKKAKKAGIKNGEAALMTVAAVATTPLAAWGGHAAGNAIANAMSGPDGMFGHWSEQDGTIIPGEKHEIKTYEQQHIDKAETWNNSDGQSHGARYTPDGSKPMESVFHHNGTYQDALQNVQAHHEGWAPEAADVNMAKLENAHLLGAPNTPLAHDPSHTLGDIMGVNDPTTGQRVTYEDVFKHLTTDPKTPLSPVEAKVMDLVAQHISADANGHMGHLLPDVGIKPQDLYSYDPSRPDGIIHNITQDPDRIIPGERTWVPNPTEDIIPYVPPYFFAQVKKLKQIKEKIGSLADRIMKKKKDNDQTGKKPGRNDGNDNSGSNDGIVKKPGGNDNSGSNDGIVNKPGGNDNSGSNDGIIKKPVDKQPNPKDSSTWRLGGIQGDNVYYGPTSGEVPYNEVEGLEDKAASSKKKDNPQPTKKRYELTDEDKASKEYSEALSKAMNGDANAIEAFRKRRETEAQKMEEMREHVQMRKEELKNRQHENKDKMHGSVVADRFAEEDIKGVEMNENTPAEYKRVAKQREADKEEFKKTGKINRFMNMFKRGR